MKKRHDTGLAAPSRVERPLTVVYRKVSDLHPRASNARKHSKQQISKLAASILEFGFTAPLLIDDAGSVLAGHGRLEAAKRAGMDSVPTLEVSHLSEAQKRAYVIADNRLAELASWDQQVLVSELNELVDLDFSMEVIGFETAQLDIMLRPVDEHEDIPEPPAQEQAISVLGDLWLLGEHRLLCGDSTAVASYELVLAGEKAQMVFTDPPYNVPIEGHVCVASRTKHGEFPMASGEMSTAQFTDFLDTICSALKEQSVDGSLHFICMDWRHMRELLEAGSKHFTELKNLCVWNKDNGGMGSLYRSKHELVFLFKNGSAPHVNNISLGKHGRNRTNVWSYPGATSMGKGRAKSLAMHPTVKPIALIADAIKDCSEPKALVLDPFGGSGSTLMAAQATGRRAALIELDPRYVDVTIRRFEERTGQAAHHAVSSLSFQDIQKERGGTP